jgi:hypothetical protein
MNAAAPQRNYSSAPDRTGARPDSASRKRGVVVEHILMVGCVGDKFA